MKLTGKSFETGRTSCKYHPLWGKIITGIITGKRWRVTTRVASSVLDVYMCNSQMYLTVENSKNFVEGNKKWSIPSKVHV